MQDRFIEAIIQLPPSLSTAIKPILSDDFAGHIDAKQLSKLLKITSLSEEQLMLELLPIAAALAKPSISQFYVGAIAKGKSGDIYMGANMELEHEALFHSVHAEQSAISHAWLKGEQQIVDIVVNFSPCGHCRQFINELVEGHKINIHLPEQDVHPLEHYLPYPFGPIDLNVASPLLSKQNHKIALNIGAKINKEPIVIEALTQVNLSYAPYSKTYAAAVLETKDGKFFSGRYAENAAFNPSMLPMQMALSSMSRHNRSFSEINRAVLIESSQGKVSVKNATIDALKSVSSIELEYISL